MRPIEAAELSAFIDRELDPVRAAEVTRALDSDPELRLKLDALAGSDAKWRSAAASAGFSPVVSLPRNDGKTPWFLTVGLVLLLGLVRFVPKAVEASGLGFSLQILALAVVLAWVIRTRTSDC